MDFAGVTSTNSLKVVFVVHFLLSSWGIQGYWSPDSYFFYNLILLSLLSWAIHSKDNPEPVQLSLAVNVISILLDIIVLGSYFPSSSYSNEKFSAVMAIVNLIARPVSSIVLARHVTVRLGPDEGAFRRLHHVLSRTVTFPSFDQHHVAGIWMSGSLSRFFINSTGERHIRRYRCKNLNQNLSTPTYL